MIPGVNSPGPSSKNPGSRIAQNSSNFVKSPPLKKVDKIRKSNKTKIVREMDDEGESDEEVEAGTIMERDHRESKGESKMEGKVTSKKGNSESDPSSETYQQSDKMSKGVRKHGLQVGKVRNEVVINPPSGNDFLSSILNKCGYIIKQPASSNELLHNVTKFREIMAEWILENDPEMSRIETQTSKFYKALHKYLLEKTNFTTSIKPTRHQTELIQPSLLHCLLGVESLQKRILEIVFIFLSELSVSFDVTDDDSNFLNTILNQLKWLPTVVDGKKLCDDLIAILNTSRTSIQSQIIKYLADIIPSSLHTYLAPKLLLKFAEEPGRSRLNTDFMDCFSAMNLPQSYWSGIWSAAIDQMANAEMQELPAYFAFLFQPDTSEQLHEVIGAMREKVDLKPSGGATRDTYQLEILQKIEFYVTMNPEVTKVWTMQVNDDYNEQLLHKIKKIDLLMLIIFAESNKKAAALLTKVLTENDLAISLFDQLMTDNKPMIYQLFKTISQFLEHVRQGKDTKSLEAICDITVCLFLNLTRYEAQTLMGNMTTILLNFPHSRATIIKILTKIVDKEPVKLLLFAPYLMSTLDHVMHFPAVLIRSLMNILAVLSQTEGHPNSNHFSAEFSILLRKQITNSNMTVRCLGVFGAMASVRKMATGQIPNDTRIRELLKLVWSFVERDEDACIIFFDELSSCVNELPVDICKQYRETIKAKFETLWIMDADWSEKIGQLANPNTSNLKLFPEFDLNKECTQDRILISLETRPMSMSSLVIPAHVRVLGNLDKRVEGSLQDINAIVGMPVLLPKLKLYYEQESLSSLNYQTRSDLGRYLVITTNFFRESICAFIGENDIYLRVKIWTRLEQVVKLQKLLVRHYNQLPRLPHANGEERNLGTSRSNFNSYGAGSSSMSHFKAAAKAGRQTTDGENVKSKKKGVPELQAYRCLAGRNKRARVEPNQTLDSDESDEDMESDNDEVDKNEVSVRLPSKRKNLSLEDEIQPKQIQIHLRHLDCKVFEEMLRKPINCSRNCVNPLDLLPVLSENPQRLEEIEQFSPETLSLLLVDFKMQVGIGRIEILRVKRVLKNISKLAGQIQRALSKTEEESIVNSEEESMEIEQVVLANENRKGLENCLQLLFGVMSDFLDAIKKTCKEEREKWIQKFIRAVAAQNSDGSQEKSQGQTVANAVAYLGNFVSILRDPTTALGHIMLLKNFHDLLEVKNEIKIVIGNTAKNYLQKGWKLTPLQVGRFLKIWLDTTVSPLTIIKMVAEKLQWTMNMDEERTALAQMNSEEGHSKDGKQRQDENHSDENEEDFLTFDLYKSCQSSNFHAWYASLIRGLAQHCQKNLRRGDFEDIAKEWIEAVGIFETLVSIAKTDSQRPKIPIFGLLLKNCRSFLDAFNRGGAVLLPHLLNQDQAAAQRIFKTLKFSCKTIQHICDHSKITSNLQLLKSVPLVKHAIETLIYRIRELMAIHGASSAFSIGSLKHRDLDGREIGSQILLDSSDLDDDDISDEQTESQGIALSQFNGMDLGDVDDDGNSSNSFD